MPTVFDTGCHNPHSVRTSYIQNAPEADLTPPERTALALLRMAGVEAQAFSEADYEARKAALEAASAGLTREVFKYWSQNDQLRVELDLDFNTPETQPGHGPPFLDLRINNLRHFVTLNFGERSRGFQWFFSFLAAFSEFKSSPNNIILLLDEPGLGLHAAAQANFLRYIEDELAPSRQVIYTTHSPFMVEPTHLERVRLVEDVKDSGTLITAEALKVGRDTSFPLQAALGYTLSQTLFVGPDNLVVEGPSDLLYLMILSDHLEAVSRKGWRLSWRILVGRHNPARRCVDGVGV